MTLVEVVAGTAILGTVLASVIIADARLTAQARKAAAMQEACEVADGLLEGWWSGQAPLPRNDEGTAAAGGRWRWRMRVVPNKQAEALGAEVVALEIFDASRGSNEPAARVELMVARKEHAFTDGTDAD